MKPPTTIWTAIADGLGLIERLADNSISSMEFIASFDNLYYKYAIDGHESEAAEANTLSEIGFAVAILRRVQQDAIDLVIPENADNDQFVSAGRIPLHELREKVLEIVCKLAVHEGLGHLLSTERT